MHTVSIRFVQRMLGILSPVLVFATTGCVFKSTSRQQSTSRRGAYGTKQNASTRSKPRPPVTTVQPEAPLQEAPPPKEGGEGRIF
jgi:hypothetical protein